MRWEELGAQRGGEPEGCLKRSGVYIKVFIVPDTAGFGGTKARVALNETGLLRGGKVPAWKSLSILKIFLKKQTCVWVHIEMQR